MHQWNFNVIKVYFDFGMSDVFSHDTENWKSSERRLRDRNIMLRFFHNKISIVKLLNAVCCYVESNYKEKEN